MFPGYHWDDKFEGTQAVGYLLYNYYLQNIKVDSHQWQWVNVQGQTKLLIQVSMHSLGYHFKGKTDMVLCCRSADLGISSKADWLLWNVCNAYTYHTLGIFHNYGNPIL